MAHPPKAKVSSYQPTKRGQLLHIDFSFWNVTSICGFSSLLSIIDGKDRMLWVFLHEGVSILSVHVDEDANSA
jgi:hypothetical protein